MCRSPDSRWIFVQAASACEDAKCFRASKGAVIAPVKRVNYRPISGVVSVPLEELRFSSESLSNARKTATLPDLHPKFETGLQQSCRHFRLTHELYQQAVDVSGYVHVSLYYVLKLVRIIVQIV